MVSPELPSGRPKKKPRSQLASASIKPVSAATSTIYTAVLAEARHEGLLDGEKTQHVSFRAPPALVEAAKREAGLVSTSDLGVLALAMMARPDPVVAFLRRTRGRLGKDHTLDY